MACSPSRFILEGPVGDASLLSIPAASSPFDFPSAAPSDDGSGDHVSGVLVSPYGTPRSAVLVIPGWLGLSRAWFLWLARRLARRGALAAVMDLPAHFGRTPAGALSGTLFLSGDPWMSWIYLRQSVSDARTVLRALAANSPGIPVTACGFSLGAWVSGAAASLEPDCAALLVTPAAAPGSLLRRSPLLAAVRSELQGAGYDVESIAAEADLLSLGALPKPRGGARLLAGEWDEVIPRDVVESLATQWCASVEFFPIGHMTPYISPGFLRRLFRFFEEA